MSVRPHRRLATIALAVLFTAIGACARPVATPAATLAPDLGKRAVGANGMVASAHPLASEAGLTVLREGGNAVDAAVATAFAIGVVEPEMSGVGGSGAMLAWLAKDHRAEFLDFYAAQPIASFRAANAVGRDSTTPMREVGVPGNVAGLLLAQERFGRLTRAQVMAPAIRLAEEGFPMYEVLAAMIRRDSADLAGDPVARTIYLVDGRVPALGEHIANPALARVLRTIAAEGRRGFYEGPIAADVIARMNRGGHPVTASDFARYEPVWRRPLCATYGDRLLLSAPPPEGGLQLVETVKLLEPARLAPLGLPTKDAHAFDLFVSAMRVGQTANRVNFDPRWRAVPARGLVSDAFVAARASEVGSGSAAATVRPMDATRYDAAPSPAACTVIGPYGAAQPAAATAAGDDGPSGGETTHISVTDGEGNAVAVTVTNSSVFGSGAAVDGFFLNNSGATITRAELDRADAPAWLTRITTIAPTLMLRDGKVELVIGSPGSGRIPLAMAQTIWYMVGYGLDPLEAVRMPRLTPSAGSTDVEVESGFDPSVLAAVRAMGYRPEPPGFEYARIYLVARRGDSWIGVADPRHDGQVRGY
ncbi:MAG TPA: gamma-glutamyltransferase [Gemmatimonadaceae bacterium]